MRVPEETPDFLYTDVLRKQMLVVCHLRTPATGDRHLQGREVSHSQWELFAQSCLILLPSLAERGTLLPFHKRAPTKYTVMQTHRHRGLLCTEGRSLCFLPIRIYTPRLVFKHIPLK